MPVSSSAAAVEAAAGAGAVGVARLWSAPLVDVVALAGAVGPGEAPVDTEAAMFVCVTEPLSPALAIRTLTLTFVGAVWTATGAVMLTGELDAVSGVVSDTSAVVSVPETGSRADDPGLGAALAGCGASTGAGSEGPPFGASAGTVPVVSTSRAVASAASTVAAASPSAGSTAASSPNP